MKEENKGITLIALVVTIVILLILAGITVASLTGDNGLIGKSGEAKKQTEISEGVEQLEIAVNQSFNKRGNIDETRLAKNLSKINGLKYINAENEEVDVTENTEIKLTAKVKLKGNNYKISDEGKVSFKKEGAIDNEDIISSPETYYGHHITNYNSTNDAGIQDAQGQLGKWQIFMADDTNIYLIASNYITRQYTGTKNNVGFDYDTENKTPETAYKMWFTSIKDQYNANTTTTDIPGILSRLNKQNIYHKWMNNPSNQTKNYNNEKAVASMLDIDIWSGYRNNTYAKYAIGGPTLEMFFKELNDSHTADKLEAIDSYNYGYKTKKGDSIIDGTTSAGAASNYPLVNSMLYLNSSEVAEYWIASPSSRYYDCIYYIMSNRKISSDRYHIYSTNNKGFRPLVCLNSNVHLVKNTDGETYSLELD